MNMRANYARYFSIPTIENSPPRPTSVGLLFYKKEKIMPKVGGKHFAYTKAGMKKAKAESKNTGKKMTNTKGKKYGK